MPPVKRLDEYFVVVRTQPRLKTRNSGAVTKSALPVLMLCNARVFGEKRKCWKCSDVRRPFVETNAFWKKKKITIRFFLEFVLRCFMYQR